MHRLVRLNNSYLKIKYLYGVETFFSRFIIAHKLKSLTIHPERNKFGKVPTGKEYSETVDPNRSLQLQH